MEREHNPIKRLMLEFKNERLVLAVRSKPTDKVQDLLAEATVRYRNQRLLSLDDSFIQVRTISGYTISNSDTIGSVIENNDGLVLVNREAWLADFDRSANPEFWFVSAFFDTKTSAISIQHATLISNHLIIGNHRFQLRSHDYIGEHSRSISVSYSSTKAVLCITLSGANKTVEVFDEDTLINYAKDGTVLAMNISESTNEHSSLSNVYFVIQQKKVVAIKLELKCASDPQAAISVWPITIGGISKWTCGKEQVLQKCMPAAPSENYALPLPLRVGRQLEQETAIPARDFIKEPNVSQGDSPLIMSQLCEIYPEQYRDSTKLYQHLRGEFSVTNNSTLFTHITRFMIEYQNSKGEWTPASESMRGYRHGEWSWSFRDSASEVFGLEERQVAKFALNCRIDLPACAGLETRPRFLSFELPVPLKLRYTFFDQDGKSSILHAILRSRNLNLPTFESVSKDYAGLTKYITVDNTVSGDRFGAIYVCRGADDTYIKFTGDSYSHSLKATDLHSYTIKAILAKQTEYDLASYNCDGFKGSAKLLIDLKNSYAYALRIKVEALESSTEEYILLPKENW